MTLRKIIPLAGLIDYWLFGTLLFFSVLSGVSSWAQTVVLPQPEVITYRQGLPQAFVPSILQDGQGFIWIATRDGLCRYDGTSFNVFQPTVNGKPGISSLKLLGLSLDPQGRIWIFSDQNDIDILDPVRERFTNISRQPFFTKNFGNDRTDAYYIDRQGRLWLSFLSDKIVCIDPKMNHLHQYKRQPIPGYFPTFSAFVQDKQGTMWMSDKTGLYRLDQRAGNFVKYPLPTNDVRGMYVGPTNDLFIISSHSAMVLQPQTGRIQITSFPANTNFSAEWHHSSIVSDSKGIIYFNVYNQLLRFDKQNRIDVLAELDPHTAYRDFLVDRSDVLWAGTTGIGIIKYNLKADLFRATPYQKDFYNDLLSRNLGLPAKQVSLITKQVLPYFFRYTFDKAGKLWFTMGNNRIYQADLQTKKLVEIPFPVALTLRHVWTDPVTSLATDPSGQLWALTDSLAVYYAEGRWQPFRYPIRSANSSGNTSRTKGIEGQMLQFVVDAQALWIATDNQGLYRIDRTNGQIRQYKHQPNKLTSLSSNQLFCLFTDPLDSTILWVGTFGSGLCRFDKRTGTCRRFTTQDGLPNNVIYAAIPDQNGFLWLATNQGICRMDRKTFQTRIYTHEDGILEDEFNRFHFLHLQNDQIILGGLGGITSFYPNKLRDDTYQPLIQITDIQVNNQPLLAEQRNDSLPVQAITKLDLPYNQNFVTVNFATLQYNSQYKIRYRHQLVGLNDDWIETKLPFAEYTDLRWGNYTLRLNGSNTSGIWSNHIRELTLVIRPPWWESWWAILVYIVAFFGIVYGLIRTYLTEQEANQLKTIDAIKARFFTNITHEFRTPLTLILGPAKKLKQPLEAGEQEHQAELIIQNANQLLGLTNQLMELAKAEANVLQVHESLGDLGGFLTQLVHSFESQAATKEIQLTFHSEIVDSLGWFDADKVERIVSNLVANSLKYTLPSGRVAIEGRLIATNDLTASPKTNVGQHSWFELLVSDTGIGIPARQLPHVFDRFYQVDNSSLGQQESSGIGLALVKELVELLTGTIQVSSTVNVGSTFTVRLPYRPVTVDVPTDHHETLASRTNSTTTATVEETLSDERPVVLLVEDNSDLSDFIVDSLPIQYQVHRARNGSEGLEKAFGLVPDLIISDIMMPIMDGYTLCNSLKNDLRTSHIPIILLTAKSSVDHRLKGLSVGADDYIAKPFNPEELQLSIHNLLKQRRQLQAWAKASVTNPGSLQDVAAPTDPFLLKLSQLMEEHLDDASFGVAELVGEIGLSRMNVHRKLKAITGISTGEFIRNYRLKRAAQLLHQGHSVSETAYLVGFEDPSYFAKSFRKVYKMTPTDFAKRE